MMLEGTWKAIVRAEECSAHCSLDFLAQKPMEHSSAKCLCMVPSVGPGELSGAFSPWTPVADSCYPGCPLWWQITAPSADGSLPRGQGGCGLASRQWASGAAATVGPVISEGREYQTRSSQSLTISDHWFFTCLWCVCVYWVVFHHVWLFVTHGL